MQNIYFDSHVFVSLSIQPSAHASRQVIKAPIYTNGYLANWTYWIQVNCLLLSYEEMFILSCSPKQPALQIFSWAITPWQQLLETGYEMIWGGGLTITTVGEEQFEVGGVITSALFPMNLLNCNFNPVLWSLQLWLSLTFHCPFSVSPAPSRFPPALVSLSPFSVSPHVSIPLLPPTVFFAPTAPHI